MPGRVAKHGEDIAAVLKEVLVGLDRGLGSTVVRTFASALAFLLVLCAARRVVEPEAQERQKKAVMRRLQLGMREMKIPPPSVRKKR